MQNSIWRLWSTAFSTRYGKIPNITNSANLYCYHDITELGFRCQFGDEENDLACSSQQSPEICYYILMSYGRRELHSVWIGRDNLPSSMCCEMIEHFTSTCRGPPLHLFLVSSRLRIVWEFFWGIATSLQPCILYYLFHVSMSFFQVISEPIPITTITAK